VDCSNERNRTKSWAALPADEPARDTYPPSGLIPAPPCRPTLHPDLSVDRIKIHFIGDRALPHYADFAPDDILVRLEKGNGEASGGPAALACGPSANRWRGPPLPPTYNRTLRV
jgi:hypothetical protein